VALHSLIAARATPCHWATPGCPVQAKFTYKRTLVTVYAMVGINGLFYSGPLRSASLREGNTFRRLPA